MQSTVWNVFLLFIALCTVEIKHCAVLCVEKLNCFWPSLETEVNPKSPPTSFLCSVQTASSAQLSSLPSTAELNVSADEKSCLLEQPAFLCERKKRGQRITQRQCLMFALWILCDSPTHKIQGGFYVLETARGGISAVGIKRSNSHDCRKLRFISKVQSSSQWTHGTSI